MNSVNHHPSNNQDDLKDTSHISIDPLRLCLYPDILLNFVTDELYISPCLGKCFKYMVFQFIVKLKEDAFIL